MVELYIPPTQARCGLTSTEYQSRTSVKVGRLHQNDRQEWLLSHCLGCVRNRMGAKPEGGTLATGQFAQMMKYKKKKTASVDMDIIRYPHIVTQVRSEF